MPWDIKKEAKSLIRHYVIGGKPPAETIREKGGQVEVYSDVLKTIQGWSGLSAEEVREAIQDAPDTIENTKDSPNFKPLYLQALDKLLNH